MIEVLLNIPKAIIDLATSLGLIDDKIDTIDATADAILVDTDAIDTRTASMAAALAVVDEVADRIEVDTASIEAKVDGIIAGTTAIAGTIKSIQAGVSKLGVEEFLDDKTITAVTLAKSTAVVLSVCPTTLYTTGEVGACSISLTSTTNVRVTRSLTAGDDRPVAVYWIVIERN